MVNVHVTAMSKDLTGLSLARKAQLCASTQHNMVSSYIAWIIAFEIIIIYGEILTFDNNSSADIIECTDGSTDCVINCINNQICQYKEIHCHRTSTISTCTINLIGNYSAENASIYTHQSPIVYINVIGRYACEECKVYAHEQLGSQLYIYVPGDSGMLGTSLFAPVGKGSLLSMKCGQDGCRKMKIYDDWTTEIYMEPIAAGSKRSFYKTIVTNIFDDRNSTANISRSDPNYIGLDTSYRAPVFLNGCNKMSWQSWMQFEYHGHNHGDWLLYGTGNRMFRNATIYATADIPPYNGSHGYNITLIASPMGNTTNDTLVDKNALFQLTLITDGNTGTNIYVEVTHTAGFRMGKIYARDANSVNIYCHQGGHCNYMMIECPKII